MALGYKPEVSRYFWQSRTLQLADDVLQLHLRTAARERSRFMLTLLRAGVQCSSLGIPIELAGPLLTCAVSLQESSMASYAVLALSLC